MPIGAGTFFPNGQFASPRSYYAGIVFNISGYIVTDTFGVYHWIKITDPTEIWTIVTDGRFYPWSSNRWTFDHMITDFWYEIGTTGIQHPQPYALWYHTRPGTLGTYIEFRWNNVDFGSLHYFDFPPQPSDYWLPPTL